MSYTNIYKHILYFSPIIGYYKILSRVPSAILLYFNTKVEAAQSCLTLCDPLDCSLPGSSVHGILQTRILEWVSIPFSRRFSWPRDRTHVSYIAGRFFLPSEPPGKPKLLFLIIFLQKRYLVLEWKWEAKFIRINFVNSTEL